MGGEGAIPWGVRVRTHGAPCFPPSPLWDPLVVPPPPSPSPPRHLLVVLVFDGQQLKEHLFAAIPRELARQLC